MKRARSDEGAYAVLYALLVVVLLGMAALAVDISALRADKRDSRTAADTASLAGAADLGIGPWTPRAACETAWTYVWANLSIGAPSSSPCGAFDALVPSCPSSLPPVRSPEYKGIVIEFTWPVTLSSPLMAKPDGLASGTRTSDPSFDGSTPGCDRLGVAILRKRTLGLASGFGISSGVTTAASVARKTTNPGSDEFTYPLVVLDPHGCAVLGVGGTNANLLVTNGGAAYPSVAGRIAVDSDGAARSCNRNDSILEVNGNTWIQALNAVNASSDPTLKGLIEIYGPAGLPMNATAAGTTVPCSQSVPPTTTPCVAQTIARKAPVTRAPFDLAFKQAVDQLATSLNPVGTSTAGWYVITGSACNAAFTGTAALGSQYFINCPAENANFKLVNTWAFPSGATVLVNGDLTLASGGCFATNVAITWNVSRLCSGLDVPASDTLTSSGIVQVRGNVDAQGGGSLVLPGTFFNMVARAGLSDPSFIGTSFSNILWTAPYYADKQAAKAACSAASSGAPAPECFRNLAYWTETTSLNTIQGGASLVLEGTFFLGEAPLRVGGNGAVSVTKSQFVARTIRSGGTKLLTFTPDPERTTGVPTFGVALVR